MSVLCFSECENVYVIWDGVLADVEELQLTALNNTVKKLDHKCDKVGREIFRDHIYQRPDSEWLEYVNKNVITDNSIFESDIERVYEYELRKNSIELEDNIELNERLLEYVVNNRVTILTFSFFTNYVTRILKSNGVRDFRVIVVDRSIENWLKLEVVNVGNLTLISPFNVELENVNVVVLTSFN